jgi:hypothetical protein
LEDTMSFELSVRAGRPSNTPFQSLGWGQRIKSGDRGDLGRGAGRQGASGRADFRFISCNAGRARRLADAGSCTPSAVAQIPPAPGGCSIRLADVARGAGLRGVAGRGRRSDPLSIPIN